MSPAVEGISLPDGLAEVLRARWPENDIGSLRDAIYLHAFARDLTAPTPQQPGLSIPGLAIPELARLLSASNQGRDRWQYGWRIERAAEGGSIVAVSGERRRAFPPGEYALTFAVHLPPRTGMAATVLFPRESLTMQAGVYYAFGDADPEPEEEPHAWRSYFHAPEELLPRLYSELTGQLNGLEIPFTLKTLLAPADRDRSDATVLYVSRRHWPQAEAALLLLPSALLSRMKARTPLFTLRLAPGIGIAESPGGGESFGMHRSRLLAESILEARRSGEEDAAVRLRILEGKFRAEGIDLAHAHVQRRPEPSPKRVELAKTNVAYWLLSRGVIPAEEAGAPWRVTIHHRRNCNFAIARGDGSGYFVKQLRVLDGESLRMMEREAAVYEHLAACGRPLQEISPAFHGFDSDAQALILELAPGASKPDYRSAAFAAAAARTLALLHRHKTDEVARYPLAERLDRRPPGIYDAHRGGPLLRWLGPGQLRLIDCVRDHQALALALDRLAADWRCDRLIHGDVKWENCIWRETVAGAEKFQWIDWELAGFGDPAWDAGCFVQAYLSDWVRSLPPQPPLSLTERQQRGAAFFSAMRPAVQAFLDEYVIALGTEGFEAVALRERIIRCAAARMAQMGLEVMHGQPAPTLEAIRLVETSAEIIARPTAMLSALGED